MLEINDLGHVAEMIACEIALLRLSPTLNLFVFLK